MTTPQIYADYGNADLLGRVRLNCVGSLEDLSEQGIELREGLHLVLYADDVDERGEPAQLVTEGVISFSKEEHCWVATVDWSRMQHVPDPKTARGNGRSAPSDIVAVKQESTVNQPRI